jgi:hypothetical protein
MLSPRSQLATIASSTWNQLRSASVKGLGRPYLYDRHNPVGLDLPNAYMMALGKRIERLLE